MGPRSREALRRAQNSRPEQGRVVKPDELLSVRARPGKSEGRKREIVMRALDPDCPLEDGFIVVGAPTQ